MLQALEQSCLEAHLLEAAWVGDPVPPEAPGERLCLVGALSLAEFHWGGAKAGGQSPRGEGAARGVVGGRTPVEMEAATAPPVWLLPTAHFPPQAWSS